MKWNLIFIIILAYLPVMSAAQQLSLQEAIEKASSAKLSEAIWQEKLAKLALQNAKANRLPLIYADGNVQRNLIIPVTPVPAIAFNPNAAPGEVMPLRFATDWSAKAGLQGSIDLFNPQNHTAIQEAKINESKAAIEINQQKYDVENTIIDLYAQCLLAIEQSKIAQASFNNYQTIEQVIKARLDAGRASQIEYNKALQQLNDLEQMVKEADAIVRINLNNLSGFIALDKEPELTTSLAEVMQITARTANYERQQLDLDYQNTLFKWKRIHWEALPKLSLNAYYGSNYFSNSFDIFNAQQWFGNSFINLSIRIPITETYQRGIQRTQLKQQLAITQIKLDDLQKNEMIKQKNKIENINIYQSKVANAQKNLQLAASNLAIIREQVNSGSVLISEYNKEMDSYFNAQKMLWQAQYDYIQQLLD